MKNNKIEINLSISKETRKVIVLLLVVIISAIPAIFEWTIGLVWFSFLAGLFIGGWIFEK